MESMVTMNILYKLVDYKEKGEEDHEIISKRITY